MSNRPKHGETRGYKTTTEYRIWMQMIGRCHTTTHAAYARYGGRGIYVCDRWRESLKNFIDDMGRRPSLNHSIERKDNNGPYCLENCVWATATEQSRNRRNNILVTMNGRTQPLSAWTEELGLTYTTVLKRIRAYGWDPIEALTTPLVKTGGCRPGARTRRPAEELER